MLKVEQEEQCSCAGSSLSQTVTSPILESPEGVLILYFCEELRIAKRDVVPILEEAGYEVQLAKTKGSKSLNLLCERCRLVLIDAGDLEAEGFRMCAQIRAISPLPIMLLLHGAARADSLRCFEAGADTFVLVPFNTREFLARLNALFRRAPWKAQRCS